MKKLFYFLNILFMSGLLFQSCNNATDKDCKEHGDSTQTTDLQAKVDEYISVKLTADLSFLSEKEKQILPLLFEAAKIMDDIYWIEAYGDKNELFSKVTDSVAKRFVEINYGPWERLNDNKSFIDGFGEKPAGANFYPADMTMEEFEALADTTKNSQYSVIRRNESGALIVIPYHEFFKEQVTKASDLLKQAAALAEDKGLKKYLELRAEALLTDDYFASDLAWMDMKTSMIDFVVGPIENYEDALFGKKTAHEAFILVKDKVWSDKLAKFAAMLPELQKGLPVDAAYKAEMPGTDSDLNAYDVLFYAGDCNAGSKTIAINLPNDELVQKAKGSRRLQLKNAMRAKFDGILKPIADIVIAPEQRKHVTFDAFFANTMFHEVAHGLGIKNVLNSNVTVRDALKDLYSGIEEGKADILGLYLVTKLHDKGEMGEADLMDNYVTFFAGIFRSVRFGGASAHGKANLVCFNYFKEQQVFTQNQDGTYTVSFEKMQAAMNSLSKLILTIQGDGNYEACKQLFTEKGVVSPELASDLERIAKAGIPRDVVFEQGAHVVGL